MRPEPRPSGPGEVLLLAQGETLPQVVHLRVAGRQQFLFRRAEVSASAQQVGKNDKTGYRRSRKT